ncbi:MAG: flagellar motor switch protein FliN [Caldilineae bacterium]|nr:MAG: flagellar motor switch protein FliN [Caldilineae bacterium]
MSENNPVEPQGEGKAPPEMQDDLPSPEEMDDMEPEFPGIASTDAFGEEPGITVNPASFAPLHPNKNGKGETTSLEMLLDIGLRVTVELGRAKMSIREVLNLGPGTVVELNRAAGEPVDILINGKPIAKGEVVVIGDMFGVRVTDIIPPAQRVESMM